MLQGPVNTLRIKFSFTMSFASVSLIVGVQSSLGVKHQTESVCGEGPLRQAELSTVIVNESVEPMGNARNGPKSPESDSSSDG